MRRSREDSLKTRRRIVRAARAEFARRGVSQTTMEQIAAAAGVTRGAVYGHFRNKGELFGCMREEVKLPLFDSINAKMHCATGDPLSAIANYLKAFIAALETDAVTRDSLRIMSFKCEYVGELQKDMKRQIARCDTLTQELEAAFAEAAREGVLGKGIEARTAALESCSFLIGLVRMWLLDSGGKLIKPHVAKVVDAHVDRFRAELPGRRRARA